MSRPLTMLAELNDALDSELFADVTFCCRTQRLQAHRILLSASSPYLQKLLLSHPLDDHVTIILDDVHHEDMAAILLFIYTGKVSVSKNRFNSFLSLASLLDIEILNPIKGKPTRPNANHRDLRLGFVGEEEYKYKLLKLELEAETYLKNCANLPKVYFMKSIERAREFVEEKMSKFEQEAKLKFEINERKQLAENRLNQSGDVDDINVAEILNNLPGMSISKVHVEQKRRPSNDRPRGLARVKPLPSLMPIQRSQDNLRLQKQTSRDDVVDAPATELAAASPSWSEATRTSPLKHWRPVDIAEEEDSEKSPLFGLLDLTMKENDRLFNNSMKVVSKQSFPEAVVRDGGKEVSARCQLTGTPPEKDDDVQIIEAASPERFSVVPRELSKVREGASGQGEAIVCRNNDIYERILRYREEIRVNGCLNSLDVREKTRQGLEIFKRSEDLGRRLVSETLLEHNRPWTSSHKESGKRLCIEPPEERSIDKEHAERRHLFVEKSHKQRLQLKQNSSTTKPQQNTSNHTLKPTEIATKTTLLNTSLQPFDRINILNKILEDSTRTKANSRSETPLNFSMLPPPPPPPQQQNAKLEVPQASRSQGDVAVLDVGVATPDTKGEVEASCSILTQALLGDAAKVHGCDDCGKHFARKQLLVQHQRIHSGVKPYRCEECGKEFTQRGHWSTHQKQHEPRAAGTHVCTHCAKSFITRASLKVHVRTHSGIKPYQCPDCNKEFSQLRNFKYHLSIHAGTNEFACTCPECGKYFNDRGYLSSHMKIHLNKKEYACQFCEKSFNQRVAYNMHVRIHTGLKPHTCTFCPKSFSRKMLLKQHMRIHTGERPFSCTICHKAFADRSNMSLHMRLHSGIKPYNCAVCEKSFTKKHHLKTHMNFHMGVKPYHCDLCGLTFSQSSNMRTHRKRCSAPKEVPA